MRNVLKSTVAGFAVWLIAVPAVHAETDWSGFYAGIYASYASVDTELEPTGSYVFDVDGFSAGALAGYMHQFDLFVLGAEGEAGYSGIDGSSDTSGWEVDMTGFEFAARARAGIAFDRMMVFGSAGFASLPMDISYPSGPLLDERQYGLQFGGGIEFAITDTMHARLEYLHTDFGDSDSLIPAPTANMKTSSDSVRVVFSRKF